MHTFLKSFAALALATGLAAPVSAEDIVPLADPSRVAVIGGSLLEIVYALGEEGKLVARDTTGIYPPEAAGLPDVGYMRGLSPEGVLAVNPTALIVIEGSGPPEALDVLAKGSVPYVSVPEGYSPDGVLEKVRVVGAALGVPEKATALIEKLDAEFDAAEAIIAEVPGAERKRVLFVISVQDGKIRAAGSGTAAHGAITLAGGINPLAEMNGYQTLSDEAILTANPDFVVMMNNSGAGDFSADLAANAALASTSALTEGRLIQMDGAYLLGFGPRTPAAILELAHAFYGDRVQP
jgi:iron complex transport system substrate-binding protein